MTTSTDITALKGGAVATAEQAQRAVKAFRALQPTLTAYARNLTKNPHVRVEMAAGDNGSTDGKRIFFRPPIALGADTKHQRSVCGRRDSDQDLMCSACRAREDVLVTIYHEIAHIAFESFAPVDSKEAAEIAADAALAAGGEWAKGIAKRIRNAHPASVRSYMAVCNLVNPFMPLLWNCLEDARVNDAMFKARPGTKVMFDSNTVKIFKEGVEQRDRATGEIVVKMWNEYPLNMQILIGLFCVASGYDYKGWFAPKIEEHLGDPELRSILRDMPTVRSAAGVYNLCFPILKRLRELGYCKTEDELDQEADKGGEGESDSPSEGGDSSSSPPSESSDGSPGDSGSGDSDSRQEEGDSSDGPAAGDSASSGGSGSDSEESDGAGKAGEDDGESESGSVDEGAGTSPDSDESGTADASDSGAEGHSDGDSSGSGSDESGLGSEDGAESDSAGSELGSDEEGDGVDEGSEETGSQAGDHADREEEHDELGGDSEQAPGSDAEESAGITGTGDAGEDQALDEGSGGQQKADSGGEDNSDEEAGSVQSDSSDLGNEIKQPGKPDDLAGDGDGADKSIDSRGTSTDEELIDTGADDGQGGAELIEDSANDETPLDYGTPEDVQEGLLKFGDHDDKPKTAHEVAGEKAVDVAIIQGLYFETPSRKITGVREHRWGVPIIEDGFNFSQAWDEMGYYSVAYGRRSGRESDTTIPESILGPALLRMRVAFSDNQRGHHKNHLKSGRVKGGVLGKRAHLNDPRLFRKKIMPGKKSYCVIIGMDISGSTVGQNIALEKRAVMAQAELCARMGISFAIYAHSGNYWSTSGGRAGGMALDVYLVKEADEPWDNNTKERLTKLGPDSANLDGHFLEYLRKRADERTETDCVILYYSDGKMPAENYDEELEILQREIGYCTKKQYTLLGVGIRTDSPARHGLDTVQVDSDEDIAKVVKHLEKRLVAEMRR